MVQLAAQGGNYHARLQLSDMYQRGLGVPRDLSKSRKWARQATADHPDREPGQIRAVFAVAVLAVIAFTFGLIALQRNSLSGWKHLVVAILVNTDRNSAGAQHSDDFAGFGIVFPHCSHSFLATDCTQNQRSSHSRDRQSDR